MDNKLEIDAGKTEIEPVNKFNFDILKTFVLIFLIVLAGAGLIFTLISISKFDIKNSVSVSAYPVPIKVQQEVKTSNKTLGTGVDYKWANTTVGNLVKNGDLANTSGSEAGKLGVAVQSYAKSYKFLEKNKNNTEKNANYLASYQWNYNNIRTQSSKIKTLTRGIFAGAMP